MSSRLAPLITRNPGPARAVAMPARQAAPVSEAQAALWMADLRLFFTAWLGGFVFIGTLFS